MNEKIKQELLSWVKPILFALVLVFVCRYFIFTPKEVLGESMHPTYETSDKVMVSKLSTPKRFDIIIFHAPDSDEDYIKRVIGLPGDHVQMLNDQLLINGKKYNEPYLAENKKMIPAIDNLTENFDEYVPKDKIFVLGDNRRDSKDSRFFGAINSDSVVGVVELRYFPFNKISLTK
ncbi:signal peptidase I [Bacillus massiliigorillae]|uniref:signal peptidase I n=1 Tax=Bacillus massiliigorillae TaxID=1243664 RepID=UPI00039AEC7A|nr:signal peptidase I [Bacillus massiliigorillae]